MSMSPAHSPTQSHLTICLTAGLSRRRGLSPALPYWKENSVKMKQFGEQ